MAQRSLCNSVWFGTVRYGTCANVEFCGSAVALLSWVSSPTGSCSFSGQVYRVLLNFVAVLCYRFRSSKTINTLWHFTPDNQNHTGQACRILCGSVPMGTPHVHKCWILCGSVLFLAQGPRGLGLIKAAFFSHGKYS